MNSLLPGWSCPHCQTFNGEAKKALARCRHCDLLHVPELTVPDEGELRQELFRAYRQIRELSEALTRTQDRSSQILQEYRDMKKMFERRAR
jgi:hypothetical protein